MIIQTTSQGFIICGTIDGHLFQRHYIGYTLPQAMEKFRADAIEHGRSILARNRAINEVRKLMDCKKEAIQNFRQEIEARKN